LITAKKKEMSTAQIISVLGKEKVYKSSVPEFGVDLHGKNVIIDKSLYGLKTSTARFHEHLSQSL
jgi:hypothetical protein